ncbi:glycosyltransferase family 2 protein [Acidomonas methanolica]|uniref:glycosyltransferase family 2 protein n=1 Tax=Acidomonas methanolica TaxID=437 RepID=UPI00211A6661|nr:glycosyltransferase family A protein [Acidomonas methanolica]MCQ9156414.1 glycosyltransferase family 2 protein [Acidomonas methanolica]
MLEKPWRPLPETLFSHETKRHCDNNDHVSVIVTNYNYEKYVTDCLSSIAAQTHEALSLVVIDDNSRKDDSTARIAEWMVGNKERFVSTLLLRNVINQGPSASRNTAIEHCPSQTIFIMDADNEILPTAIAKLNACLERSGAQAAYSQLIEFEDRNQVGAADLWDVERMYKNNYVDIMALMRKSAWAEVGGFSHIEEGWEDYDFWLKFIDKGIDIVFLPEILCRYRVHGVSRTATEAYKSHYDLEIIMRYRHPDLPAAPQSLKAV